MEISKSTPYVRYRENISSSLHKGTVHIESEYLDRERKTTIESIEGQTWQNLVANENKELELLGVGSIGLSGDIYDTGEKRLAVDVVMGNATPTLNEDGTYTYSVSTMEGEYARTFDGVNHITSTSDGLDGEFHIKYNTQGEEIIGNFSMNGEESHVNVSSNGLTPLADISYKMYSTTDVVSGTSATIEDGKASDMVEGVIYGESLVNRVIGGSQTYECAKDIIVSGEATNYVELDGTAPTSNKLELSVEAEDFILVDKFVLNKILDVNNKGVVTDATNEVATVDYLPIPAKEFTFKTTSMSGINYIKGAFYDKDKVYINRFGNGNGTSSYTVTVPSNAVYMRIGYYITNSTTSPFETSKHWIKLVNINTQECYWDDSTVKNPIVVVGSDDSVIEKVDVDISTTPTTIHGTIEDRIKPYFEGQSLINIFKEDLTTHPHASTCDYTLKKNYYSLTPTVTGQRYAYTTMGAYLKANTTYTLFFGSGRPHDVFVKLIKNNNGESSQPLKNKQTFTPTESGFYCLRLFVSNATIGWEYSFYNLMIIEGDYLNDDIVYFTGVGNVSNPKLLAYGDSDNIFNERYFSKKPMKQVVNGLEYYTGAGSIIGNSTFVYDGLEAFVKKEVVNISFNSLNHDNLPNAQLKIKYVDNTETSVNIISNERINVNTNGKSIDCIYITRSGSGNIYIRDIRIKYGVETTALSYVEPNNKLIEPTKNFTPVLEEEEIVNIYNSMGHPNVSATYSNGKFTLNGAGAYTAPNKVWKLKPNQNYTCVIEGDSIEWTPSHAYNGNGTTNRYGGQIYGNTKTTLWAIFTTDSTGCFGFLPRFTADTPVTFKIYERWIYDILPLDNPVTLNACGDVKDTYENGVLALRTSVINFKDGNFILKEVAENTETGYTRLWVQDQIDRALGAGNVTHMTTGIAPVNGSFACYGSELHAGNATEECITPRANKSGFNIIINTSRLTSSGTPTTDQAKTWLKNNMPPIIYARNGSYYRYHNLPTSCVNPTQEEAELTSYIGETSVATYSSQLTPVNAKLKDVIITTGANYTVAKVNVELKELNGAHDTYDYKTGTVTRNIVDYKYTGTWGGAEEATDEGYNDGNWWFVRISPSGLHSNVKMLDSRIVLKQANIAVTGQWHFYMNKALAPTTSEVIPWLKKNIFMRAILKTPEAEIVQPNIKSKDGSTLTSIPSYNVATKLYGASETVNLLMKYSLDLTSSIPLQGVSANRQYTICYNRVGTANLSFKIGETKVEATGNKTLITPTTSSDKMLLIGSGNTLNNIMLIEGDVADRELPYFEGLTSVENPLVTVCGRNLFNPSKHTSISYDGLLYTCQLVGKDEGAYYHLEPNTEYRIKVTSDTPNVWFQIQFNGNFNNGAANNYLRFTTDDTGKTFIKFGGNSEVGRCRNIYMSKVEDFIGENFTLPPIHANLSTTPQITLHGIGDVKDEWDVVNETVTRRVGEIIIDGSQNIRHHNYNNVEIFTVSVNGVKDGMTQVLCNRVANHNSISHDFTHFKATTNGFEFMLDNSSIRTVDDFKQYLDISESNPITIQYKLLAPTTESVLITPQNPKTSTASVTINEPLNTQDAIHDKLRWNPYKGYYVRYNHIVDGVAYNQHRTIENLYDLGERKFVELYKHRTYFLPTNGSMESRTHGTSVYCLAEQGKQYCVRWDWIEAPTVDTIKVDLCGNTKIVPSTETSVVIDATHVQHNFVQLQGNGLQGRFTNLMVIETVNGEIPDVDFFSGVKAIGNTVQVDGVTKVQIDVEQINGNLLDTDFTIYNNGNNIDTNLLTIKPNKTYRIKCAEVGRSAGVSWVLKDKDKKETNRATMAYKDVVGDGGLVMTSSNDKYLQMYRQTSENGSANIHSIIEVSYADMAKDSIRPRYHDMKSFILPMKLCRVGEVYDSLYYDDLKGYYRIQQSIGHKYFTGDASERWEMGAINLNSRTVAFTYKNGDINQLAMGDTICNGFKRLKDVNQDTEGFIIYNGDFVLRIDKERIEGNCSIDGLRAYLTSYPIHLFYQLKTPQMVDLPQYPNRLELNTYRDEVFTFIKDSNPTKFTLSIPMDRTYRFDDHQEGQGLANRVSITDERISSENVVAIQEIRGKGIANLIEDPNNVPVTPLPNYSGVATSHQLTNTKPSIVHVHGFEPSGDTKIGTWNTTDKKYQIKVMSGNSNYSLSDYYVLDVPYQLETYPDGTKDRVYYNVERQEWQVNGSYDRTIAFNASTGAFTEAVEIFRGMTPRSGMIAEFKIRFTSGTTTARLYYSVNGSTYSYVTLRGMVDDQDYYLAFFNTGGTKIDYSTKVGATTEYASMTALSATIPEGLFVNQIQSLTECTHYVDKFYQYPTLHTPIELDTYDGTTNVYIDGKTTDTNIIINNDCFQKVVNTYEDVEYTVYWKYLSGDGKLTITLGGTRVEVDGTKGYATIRTQLQAPQELVYIGGYNLSIQDVMVVKGARIDGLAYFEGSRQVGTLVVDEHGNKQYKITLVQGGSVLEQKDYDKVEFKDDNKHNVVVHKIVGVRPTKVD